MADWRRALSEDEIPAAFRNVYGDRTEKPLSVKGAEIGVEFTPAGTIFGLNDIKEELQKENPDYYKVGMMAGVEAIGLIPGLGDAAVEAIKAGAKKAGLDKVANQTDALLGGPKPNPEMDIFGGAKASNPPNMRDYGGIESSFENEADFQTQMDLDIDFENDPSGSMVRMMDEIERNPAPYQKTLQEIGLGKWFRGRDNLMRFEIDDSASKATPDFATVHTRDELDDMFSGHDYEDDGFMSPYDPSYPDSQEKMYSTLSDVFSHRELFEKYPELSDMPVVVDETMDADTLGYYDPRKGLVALSPEVAKDADAARSTLLHEIQHAVQRIEGFETGTGTFNLDVVELKSAARNSPTIKNLEADYEKELDKYFDSAVDIKTDFISQGGKNLAELMKEFELRKMAQSSTSVSKNSDAISFEKLKSLYGTVGSAEELSKLLRAKDIDSGEKVFSQYSSQMLAAEKLAAGQVPYGFSYLPQDVNIGSIPVINSGVSYLDEIKKSTTLADSNTLADNYLKQLQTNFARIADIAIENKDQKLFKKVFKVAPEKVVDNFLNGSPEYFLEEVSGIKLPLKPDEPFITPLKVDDYPTNKVIYRAKRGEAEARNVQARMDMPASKRTPENVYSTEDVVPEEQWGAPELRRAKAGEDIFAEGKIFGLKGEPKTELDPEPDPKQSFIEKLRKKFGFAEGGAVGDMNRQMELFARGGLKDDGMNMDPVSGNEVPSGSLAKEVRDDIPAQLSEGEYVVPADVVRYYGVKFFEDLRGQAKMGLTEMEADGRIGGEPVMDQGVTEEDLAALDQMLTTGAANGGLMDKLEYAAKNDPMVNQRLNQGGMVVGFAEGGMTQSLYSDPNQIDMVINKVMAAARQNPEIMEQLSARGIQFNRTEPQMPPQQMDQANPPKETRQAMAMGGMTAPDFSNMTEAQQYSYITSPTQINPIYGVPGASYTYAEDGALPQPTAQAPVETSTTPTASPEYCNSIGMMFDPSTNSCVPKSKDDSPEVPKAEKSSEEWFTDEEGVSFLNFSDPDSIEEWAKGLSQPMKGEDFLKGAGVLVGGPAALLAGGASSLDALTDVSDLRAAQIIAEARGDTELAETLGGYVDERLKSSSKIANMLDDVVATGKQKANRYAQYLGFEDLEDMSKPENKEKLQARTRQYTVKDMKQDQAERERVQAMSRQQAEAAGIDTGGGGGSYDPFKEAATGTATITDSTGKDRTVVTYDPDKVKEAAKKGTPGGRARGGLMQKRK